MGDRNSGCDQLEIRLCLTSSQRVKLVVGVEDRKHAVRDPASIDFLRIRSNRWEELADSAPLVQFENLLGLCLVLAEVVLNVAHDWVVGSIAEKI